MKWGKEIFFLFVVLLVIPGCGGAQKGGKDYTDRYEIVNRVTSSTMSKKLNNVINTEIVKWLGDSKVLEAINKSNVKNKSRSEEDILKADAEWRMAKDDDPLILGYMDNSASVFLKGIQVKSGGLYSEIFVMDFQGCNVALSNKTSDFWQGDEDKFQISYNNGSGKILIDRIEYDESSKLSQVQISLPVEDPSTRKVSGAVTIGVNINKL